MTSEKALSVIHHFMAALDRKYELVSMEECSLEPEYGWIISLKTEIRKKIIKYLVSTDGCYAFVEMVTNGDGMDKLCKKEAVSELDLDTT